MLFLNPCAHLFTRVTNWGSQVVESVLVLNPGSISKKKAAGTYAQMAIHPRKVTDEERAAGDAMVGHKIFERARVDVVRV